MSEYTVYMHVTPCGKRYIGITRQKVEARWRGGKGYKNCVAFCRAIGKYGWDNIEHLIVAEGLSEREAKELEQKTISEYRSNNKKYGYNCTSGGDGVHDWVPTDKQRERNSLSKKELWRNEEYRERQVRERRARGRTEEERNRLRQMTIGNWNDKDMRDRLTAHLQSISNNPELRKRHSEAMKDLWADAEGREAFLKNRKPKPRGKDSCLSKPVVCVTTGETFACGRDAAEHFGISYKDVSACATKRIKRAHGLQFEFV